MDSNSWFFGFSQNFISDLLILFIALVGGAVMVWAREKGWRWATPVLYGLLTGASLFILLSGLFGYYDRRESIRPYTPATPCQMRMSPGERERILKFLREHASQRQRVKKIDIVVEQDRKDDCLYAEDLQYVFHDKGLWGPAEIIVEPVHGKAVWFESSLNDELARILWEQTLCHLSQDFYYEDQEDVAPNTWKFFVGDREGGAEDFSPEVMCPNKHPGQGNPSPNP